MNKAGQIDRKELAASIGMRPGTFYRMLLEFNRQARSKAEPELKPDAIEYDSHRTAKFFFNPERAAEFKAALEQLAPRGLPTHQP